MTQPQETDILVEALRSALDQQPDALRAGQLRLELERSLGLEASQALRREIHQIVAAAEEHLPTRLVRITPLTTPALARLSRELATTRGWKPETAERTTRTWAAALGFDELAAETWPLVPATGARPTASIEPAAGATALPPAQPAGIGDDISIRGAGPVWPPPAKRLSLAHAESESGRPVLGVVQAYAGVSLTAFTGVISLLTVALVAVLLLLPGSGWLLVLVGVGAATYATRFLQYGALLATEIGIEFVPYDGNMRRARPERSMHATWDEVAVMLGKVSSVSAGGRRFQVGPRNKAFALACQAQAGSSAGGTP